MSKTLPIRRFLAKVLMGKECWEWQATLNEVNRRKTHCPHGHEYTPANTRIGSSGSRFCIACQHIRNRTKRVKV